MGLSHVVITAVARDDLPDGGAAFQKTIEAVRRPIRGSPLKFWCRIFWTATGRSTWCWRRNPVFNHNLETVRRLTPRCAIRPTL